MFDENSLKLRIFSRNICIFFRKISYFAKNLNFLAFHISQKFSRNRKRNNATKAKIFAYLERNRKKCEIFAKRFPYLVGNPTLNIYENGKPYFGNPKNE